jgi:outer membrane protein assembly factor BamB
VNSSHTHRHPSAPTQYRGPLALCLSFLLASACVAAGEKAPTIPDFTFIQASDVHTPMPQSKATLAKLAGLGEIDLAPFGIKVAKPSFAIVTGDTCEFGGGAGAWEEYLSYWNGCGLPVHHALGNHDNTWDANIKRVRDLGQGPYYSFDDHGCHFVCLMSATAQDPRPSFGEEQILWLKKDLKKIGPNTPLFVFFHHPLPGTEFASRYDYDRLLDVLRPYNTVLLMAGHSHGHVHRLAEGIDETTGGSTFGPTAGFAIISVKGGMVREAYWKAEATAPDLRLLEKPLPARSTYPQVEIRSPAFRQTGGAILNIAARLSGGAGVQKATYTIDDEIQGELKLAGHAPKWHASGKADVTKLLPGAHYLRVAFASGDAQYTHSTEFFFEPENRPTAWRAYLAASSKVTPATANGVVYVGANDGKLRAFKARTGKALWSADTGAEILAEPLVDGGRVFAANGLGTVAAYATSGKRLWSFAAGNAVYSSPIMVNGKVVFGCNNGWLYALDASNGRLAWINTNATYAIESKPFAWNGKVYYGAWDQNIRCVNATDGKLLWERICEGSRVARAAKRYYSPADAMPVVAEGKLMMADRNMMLTILNAETGEPVDSMKGISATGVSEDGRFVYLRKLSGDVVKIDSSGKELWSTPSHVGAIPTAPTEKNGVVYVCSGKGTVSALAADTGKILWQYQASPQLFVMGSVVSDGVNAYLTAFDGTLTAINLKAVAAR